MGIKMDDWYDIDEKDAKPLGEKAVKKTIAKKTMIESAPVNTSDKDDNLVLFASEKMREWLYNEVKFDTSSIFCGVYGWDGTGKTGLTLDCRTPEEIKEGKKIIVLDLDGGAGPLQSIYHGGDENIIVKNPIERNANLDIDYEKTFKRIKATAMYIEQNKVKDNICAVVLDGLDKLLKICEYSMRADLDLDTTEGVSFRYWTNRNVKYMDVIEPLKNMGVAVFLITHLKSGENAAADDIPIWQKKTPDMLFQKIHCFKTVDTMSDGTTVTEIKATIKKCKTNLSLEEKTFVIAEVMQHPDGRSEEKWNGLQFRAEDANGQKRTVVYQQNEKGIWCKK